MHAPSRILHISLTLSPSLALLKQLALVPATIANSLLESDLIYVLSWYPFGQAELR